MATRLTQEDKTDIYLMWKSGRYYNSEIADWIGCSTSTIGRVIKEMQKKEEEQNDSNKQTLRKH